MSETLNQAVAFLDAAIAELDKPTRPVPDRAVVELRRDKAAHEVPPTGAVPPRPAA